MTELERAAIAYIAAKRDFDTARYAYKPWRSYDLAFKRMKKAAADATKNELTP